MPLLLQILPMVVCIMKCSRRMPPVTLTVVATAIRLSKPTNIFANCSKEEITVGVPLPRPEEGGGLDLPASIYTMHLPKTETRNQKFTRSKIQNKYTENTSIIRKMNITEYYIRILIEI